VSGESIDVDISGFGLRFEGLTPALSAEVKRHWRDYVRLQGIQPALAIRVEDEDRAMISGRFMEGALRFDASPDVVRFQRDEGQVIQDADEARAVARLARGDEGRRFWGLVNLACAAVGWRLLARGGGALHAAAALVGTRAFLLVGPSGCGKTTWARTAADAGLPILSDDCVLVESVDGRLVALGSPFRSKDFPSAGPGRWPVAAILIPRHAAEPSLAPVSRLMLEARIAANLLFSAGVWESHPTAVRAASAIADGAPARVLSFRPDASWIQLVAAMAGDPDASR
jgi:hypothetical protein